MKLSSRLRPFLVLPVAFLALFAGGAVRRVQDQCGPFTDVSPLYCPAVLEAYETGIAVGTSSSTFSTDAPASRGQAVTFATRALDSALSRGSRRAGLGQWWNLQPGGSYPNDYGTTTVGDLPALPASDGADVWVPNSSGNTVSRVRASDGRLLETWTGAEAASAALVAMGRVFVTGQTAPGKLYMIDPASPSGDVATVTTDLGQEPVGIAFDGTKIWTVNQGGSSFQPSVSIVIPGPPWSVQTVTTGFVRPVGIVFDGSNMWIADQNLLLKLDEFGAIVQTVALDGSVGRPTFDGVNVIAPTTSPTLWAVRASTGERVGGVSNGPMDHPVQAVFDGQRILVLNPSGSFSLFRASDYSVITFGPLNAIPFGACSDGVNFWITLTATPGRLARY